MQSCDVDDNLELAGGRIELGSTIGSDRDVLVEIRTTPVIQAQDDWTTPQV